MEWHVWVIAKVQPTPGTIFHVKLRAEAKSITEIILDPYSRYHSPGTVSAVNQTSYMLVLKLEAFMPLYSSRFTKQYGMKKLHPYWAVWVLNIYYENRSGCFWKYFSWVMWFCFLLKFAISCYVKSIYRRFKCSFLEYYKKWGLLLIFWRSSD